MAECERDFGLGVASDIDCVGTFGALVWLVDAMAAAVASAALIASSVDSARLVCPETLFAWTSVVSELRRVGIGSGKDR